jgi:hypothetical protein
MKTMAGKYLGRVVQAAYNRLPFVESDGFNIADTIRLKAAMDTAEYCIQHLPRVPTFRSSLDLLSHALQQVSMDGHFLEFGVASGTTINHISSQVSEQVHGFDSFEGLPEDWRPG